MPSDSRILITAGGAGIGRAMGVAFTGAGARVWVTDVDAEALAACPDSWRKTQADAADPAAMSALFNEIETEWSGLDTLAANAGIAGPTALVEEVAFADWKRCLAVNLDGAFLAAHHAAPMMKRQGSGALLITSSVAGLFGLPRRTPYSTAKWGMIGLMKTLAMELGPHGIRVNALCPGAVEGPRIDRVIAAKAEAEGLPIDQVHDSFASASAMRTFVTASDIANMALFLASPEARHVSGQAIAVDGGYYNPDPKI
ncbi:MAG: SDR family oxidoreductase [Paracoccaceae bacterium]|nr:SDR family oxidoreductase [Paracoccaceae bacterium]